MTTLIRNRQFITLCLLTLCFFASPISVTVTTITYCAAFFCVLISGDWQSRWQSIQCNRAAWSFWILFFLFLVGASYSTSPWRLIFFDIQKRHWLLITPFLMMVMQDALWRRRMINAFLSAMIVTLLFAYAHYFFKVNITGKTSNLDLSTDIVFAFHIVQSFAMNIAAFICAYRTLFEKKCRWCYAVIYFVMAVDIIFLSDGRTGYIIFILIFAYLGLIRFGWRGVVITIAIASAMMLSAYGLSHNFRFRVNSMIQHTTHYSTTYRTNGVGQRIEMYHIAKTMIAKRPWFGYGTGGINTEMQKIIPAKDRVLNSRMNFVESIYLNFLLEFGVVGFAVLLIAIAFQIQQSFLLTHEYRSLIHIVLINVFIGGLINKFFVSSPIVHMYSLFAALCFG
ncbi:MAG: O-antigen ligase [uncultured bacterium]|nr:MAG: O-antigen ligase [uncultured bacterium]OGT25630.1 MAG: hypothetical protein A3B71_06265 [Gammaproteobacteria bacterium RIFCSPHIGHO2_02_FULL_42_43]OGT28684.1 MAG: hypothetical protein A2624_01005 [Gammaproteobacteria bacterium RIFCSPHIGHO2_01_FULL_42_8]OGT51585.1 MAG: hypothetical protein A3E54_06030 [Gammaproteobacteria bacterium RIFCSPHIGHO2_12_FULL_41_25]OGT62284.1 MAG: hypothetical protein A3I77_04965 [Gammaproteobacteria bacterium RIFCSPLOWO2_02_FULL_42_14]OGT85958.1 MAG: hypotheti